MFDKKFLCIKSFALAGGLTCSIIFGVLGVFGLFGFGHEIIYTLSDLFIGYDASGGGVFVGMIWGYVAGGVSGLIFAWVYNKVV